MRAYLTLARRELASYFLSMLGYVIIAAAAFMMGMSFLVMVVNLHGLPTPLPVTELFYMTPFFWLILLAGAPVITMRLFALEKFSGTYETLMTTPVSELQVLMAKFTAAMVFYLLMWLPLLACLQVLRHFTSEGAGFDPATIASTFLGILLIGGMFISLGCCASAVTRNQVIAACLTLGFGVTIFLLGVLGSEVAADTSARAQFLSSFALFDHMHDFARGIVDTRPIIFLVSLTLFFLFLTLRILESRRWR
ncbi:MAG TPA: ABC transporter permease [Verrucomicrobiae bacterium]|nr:ABC transporter permease [Verrucomicrobiae bacterium]